MPTWSGGPSARREPSDRTVLLRTFDGVDHRVRAVRRRSTGLPRDRARPHVEVPRSHVSAFSVSVVLDGVGHVVAVRAAPVRLPSPRRSQCHPIRAIAGKHSAHILLVPKQARCQAAPLSGKKAAELLPAGEGPARPRAQRSLSR